MIARIAEDVRTVLDRDPAARSVAEVLLTYPGLHAIWFHRVNHWLWERGLKLPARLLSHLARFLTGIEIHPGATIGRRFFIDHGGGVVIGETAEIGDDVLLFQGCTLGGTSNEPVKRHPTVEDNVVIGAGAILLGPITIGAHSQIGAGSVVLDDYPANSTIVGVPASSTEETTSVDLRALEHGDIPDPIHSEFDELNEEVEALRERIDELESRLESADEPPTTGDSSSTDDSPSGGESPTNADSPTTHDSDEHVSR